MILFLYTTLMCSITCIRKLLGGQRTRSKQQDDKRNKKSGTVPTTHISCQDKFQKSSQKTGRVTFSLIITIFIMHWLVYQVLYITHININLGWEMMMGWYLVDLGNRTFVTSSPGHFGSMAWSSNHSCLHSCTSLLHYVEYPL